MKVIKNEERMNRRCEKLQELGFTILHQDSKVGVPLIGTDSYIEMDFSAIDENKFHLKAIRNAFAKGIDKGEENIRYRLKQVMGIK